MAMSHDHIPVTGAMLSFIQAVQAAKKLYLNESSLAEHLGLPAPQDYWERCKKLFFETYAAQADAIGLHRNLQTFGVVMEIEVTPEMRSTNFNDLPKRFAFDPWAGQGRGGFIRLQD